MITLYQTPMAWGTPNLSPFCFKLEAYFRMVGLPYQVKMAELLNHELGGDTPPLVFMSAVDCRNQTQAYGTFLFKPFTLETLFDTIESILND